MVSESLTRTMVTNKLAGCYTSLTHLLSENFGVWVVEPARRQELARG